MRSDISKSFSKINEEVKTYPINEVVAQQARLKDLLSNIKEAELSSFAVRCLMMLSFPR